MTVDGGYGNRMTPEQIDALMSVDVAQTEMFARGMQRAEEAGLITVVGEGDAAQVQLTPDGLCVGAVIMSMLEKAAGNTLVVPGRDT